MMMAGARGQIPDVEDGQGRPYPESATRKQIPDEGSRVVHIRNPAVRLCWGGLVLNVNCLATPWF